MTCALSMYAVWLRLVNVYFVRALSGSRFFFLLYLFFFVFIFFFVLHLFLFFFFFFFNDTATTEIYTLSLHDALPIYLNGNPGGMLIEACAGTLDQENPMDCIIRETREETGYHIPDAQKVYELYVTPGAVTELMYLYVAEYTPEMKLSKGGGLEEENENIENIELSFSKVLEMVKNEEIKDAKTVVLLQYAQLNIFS